MSAAGKRTISIALLIADTLPENVASVRGQYLKIYTDFFNRSLATIKRHRWQEELVLDIRPFDIVNAQHYPSDGQLNDGLWDAVVITGSASSVTAHESNPWMQKLFTFIQSLVVDHPLVRLMGICWGHQAIAQALGGEVEENEKGWELGVYDLELNEQGQEVWGFTKWDLEDERDGGAGMQVQQLSDDNDSADVPEDGIKRMRLQQVHKDHVVSLPDPVGTTEFNNLCTTSTSEYQSLGLKYPTDSPPLPSVAGTSQFIAFDTYTPPTSSGPSIPRGYQVLTLQGHPEFDSQLVEMLIHSKTAMGPVPNQEEALKRAARSDDAVKVGQRLLCMLGVEQGREEGGESL
ncbi:unnamed protein product [Sympodiomycopsis kandeliae]